MSIARKFASFFSFTPRCQKSFTTSAVSYSIPDIKSTAKQLASLPPSSYTTQTINQALALLEDLNNQKQFNMKYPTQCLMRVITSYNNWLIPIHFQGWTKLFQPATPNTTPGLPPYCNRVICTDETALETCREFTAKGFDKEWKGINITGIEALSIGYLGDTQGVPAEYQIPNPPSGKFKFVVDYLVINPGPDRRIITWPAKTFQFLHVWSACMAAERRIAASFGFVPFSSSEFAASCGAAFPEASKWTMLLSIATSPIDIHVFDDGVSSAKYLAFFTAPDLAREAFDRSPLPKVADDSHWPFNNQLLPSVLELAKDQLGKFVVIINPVINDRGQVDLSAPTLNNASHSLQNIILDEKVIKLLSDQEM